MRTESHTLHHPPDDDALTQSRKRGSRGTHIASGSMGLISWSGGRGTGHAGPTGTAVGQLSANLRLGDPAIHRWDEKISGRPNSR